MCVCVCVCVCIPLCQPFCKTILFFAKWLTLWMHTHTHAHKHARTQKCFFLLFSSFFPFHLLRLSSLPPTASPSSFTSFAIMSRKVIEPAFSPLFFSSFLFLLLCSRSLLSSLNFFLLQLDCSDCGGHRHETKRQKCQKRGLRC